MKKTCLKPATLFNLTALAACSAFLYASPLAFAEVETPEEKGEETQEASELLAESPQFAPMRKQQMMKSREGLRDVLLEDKAKAAEKYRQAQQARQKKAAEKAGQKPEAAPTPAASPTRPTAPPAEAEERTAETPPAEEGVTHTKTEKVNSSRKQEIEGARAAGSTIRVTFKDADIMELIQTVSEATKKNFIIPQNMKKAKVTLLSPTPISPDELWAAFLSVLEINDLALVPAGKYFKVVASRDSIQGTIPIYMGSEAILPEDDQAVTWLYRLEYVDANTIIPTIKALTSARGGQVLAYTPTNTLIMSDSSANLNKIKEVIKQLDVQSGGEDVFLIEVKYATAQEITDKITQIFDVQRGPTTQKRAPKRGADPAASVGDEESVTLSKVIPDERTNKIIIIANERSYQRVRALINKLDVPVEGEGQIHVHYLSFADAEKMSQTLSQLAQGHRPQSKRPGQAQAPGSTGELFSGEIKITADKPTNSLVIMANQNDFRNLQKIIDKLDIARRQVYVEAVIMEVGLDRTTQFGLAFHGGTMQNIQGENVPIFFGTNYSNLNSVLIDPTSLASLAGFVSGMKGPELEGSKEAFGMGIPSFGALLHALKTNSDVNILSTPHILTTDNEEASIIVGENVPFQSGFTTGFGGAGGGSFSSFNPIVSIQRQDVALTLKVKPQINASQSLSMTIEQEVSDIARESQLLGPTTNKRSVKTVVTVRDQQTVVIGGLIRARTVNSDTKVPFLGDIPILGWLFRSSDRKIQKTNLLLIITPYIIREQDDFRKIFERKMKERQEFVENFYGGERLDYMAYYDHSRIKGPFSNIKASLEYELQKAEHGGPGADDEILIHPETGEEYKRNEDEDERIQGAGMLKSRGGDSSENPPLQLMETPALEAAPRLDIDRRRFMAPPPQPPGFEGAPPPAE